MSRCFRIWNHIFSFRVCFFDCSTLISSLQPSLLSPTIINRSGSGWSLAPTLSLPWRIYSSAWAYAGLYTLLAIASIGLTVSCPPLSLSTHHFSRSPSYLYRFLTIIPAFSLHPPVFCRLVLPTDLDHFDCACCFNKTLTFYPRTIFSPPTASLIISAWAI